MSTLIYILSLIHTSDLLYEITRSISNFWYNLIDILVPTVHAEITLPSYKIDKIIILGDELDRVRLNSLSAFMRMEKLKAHIVQWNLLDMSSIHINLPEISNSSSNIFLSKLTYTVEGDITNKVYNLKDSWPVNGGDLAFKPEEGLKIRRLLGLGLDQEIKIVTTKELPSLPTPQTMTTSLNSSLPRLNCSLASLNDSSLFYNSRSNLVSTESISICEDSPVSSSVSSSFSPISDHCSVELYHTRRTELQEYLNRPLPTIPTDSFNAHNYEEVRMLNRRFTIHSEILEDSTEDLLDSSNNIINHSNRSSLANTNCSTLLPGYEVETNPYSVLPTYEESEISYPESRISRLTNLNTPSSLIDRSVFQNVDWSSTSPSAGRNNTTHNLLSEID